MAYRKIKNLYKNQIVLMFKELFVSEKIHGTSAHVKMWREDIGSIGEGENKELVYRYETYFFSGGSSHDLFVALFDKEKLIEQFKETGCSEVILYGEAYGGKQQGMRETYGDNLKFIVFEAKVSGCWLDMERAEYMAQQFEQDFVWYTKCKAEVEILDQYRDQFSVQAKRNGCGEDKKAEGIVIRPTMELTTNNGGRLLAKHKREDFKETRTKRKVQDPAMLKILEDAKDIAIEWVTPMRLTHVLDKLKGEQGITEETKNIPVIIKAMQEDIKVEAEGEIVYTKAAERSIGKETVKLFKQRLNDNIKII